jgi:hypothetical protein
MTGTESIPIAAVPANMPGEKFRYHLLPCANRLTGGNQCHANRSQGQRQVEVRRVSGRQPATQPGTQRG